jgi:anthranilate phosphoribosyltransferase
MAQRQRMTKWNEFGSFLRGHDAGKTRGRQHVALGRVGGEREIVALNAGTALYAAGRAASIGEGIERAREAIASGAALRKLDEFVRATQSLGREK